MKTIKLLEEDAVIVDITKGSFDDHVNELHDFLNEPTYAQGHEWEGHNSGIYINLSVAQGDYILVNDDQSIRVLRRGKEVLITKAAFPRVYEAMLAVEYDNGAHHVNRIEGPGTVDLDTFKMPFDYGVDKLVRSENALDALKGMRGTPDAIEDFACGEQGEIETMIKLLESKIPDLGLAHALINDWFNAWETA